MIEIASVTLLGGVRVVAARNAYPSTPMYYVENPRGDRKFVVNDVQWADRIREGMADHEDLEKAADFVRRQVEDTHVMENQLSLTITRALGLIRQLVEVAQR